MRRTSVQQFGNIAFFARWTWLDRLFSILGFKSATSIQAAPKTAPSISTPSLKPLVTPPVQPTPPSREMHTTVVTQVAARIPLIKFVGARLPRPNFVRGPMPSIPISGNVISAPLAGVKASSIGPVGKIPRGQGIPESSLPRQFQRQPISQEECDAINAGGSYGL